MATKNLVPRANNEGELGISTRKWKGINAVSGSFETLTSDVLKNIDGNPLIAQGDNISIVYENTTLGQQYIINSTLSGASQTDSDKIFKGTDSDTVKVQTVSDTSDKKIQFITNNTERWFISELGHYLPSSTHQYDIGKVENSVRMIYLNSNSSDSGLMFITDNQDKVSINLSDEKRLQISSDFSSNTFSYDKVVLYKSPVTAVEDSVLSSFTYNSGIFTETSQSGALIIDGVTIVNNDRVLIKSQTSLNQNGIYVAEGIGSGSTVTLTRSSDLSTGSDFSGSIVHVLKGTSNEGKVYYASSASNGDSLTGSSELSWLSINSSGIKDIIEDTTPQLGGNLDLNNKFITDSSTIKIFSQGLSASSNANEGLEINKNEVKISYTTTGTPTLAQPTLTLGVDSSRILKIESPDATFFTTPNISVNDFTFKFSSANMSPDEISARSAFFATQGWVTGQIDAITPVDTSTFVVKDSNTSLKSLTLSEGITNNPDYGLTLVNKKIGGLALPTELTDAANKQYVDSVAQGITTLKEVRVATDAELTGILYNGTAKTISSNTNVSINTSGIDNITNLDIDNRILVKDQTAGTQNGIYKITALGNSGLPWEMVRVADFDNNFQANGSFVFVEEGTSNNATGFICISPTANDTVGTDDIEFVLFSKAGSITAGSGLTGSSQFEVKVKPADVGGSPNTNRLIYIDTTDSTVHANIDNIITKINESSTPITGATASSFTFPTTELTPITNTTKILANDSANKYVNGLNLKQFILNFDASDISFAYTAATGNDPEQYVANLNDNSVGKLELSKDAITGQAHKQKSIDTVLTNVGPDDSDVFLITDSENSDVLRKVSFSKIKENISAVVDINGKDSIDTLSSDDELIVYDKSSTLNKKTSLLDLVNYKLIKFMASTSTSHTAVVNQFIVIDPTGTPRESITITLPAGTTGDPLKEGDSVTISISDTPRSNEFNQSLQRSTMLDHGITLGSVNVKVGTATINIIGINAYHLEHKFLYNGTDWVTAYRHPVGIDSLTIPERPWNANVNLQTHLNAGIVATAHRVYDISNNSTVISLPSSSNILKYARPTLYMNIFIPGSNEETVNVTINSNFDMSTNTSEAIIRQPGTGDDVNTFTTVTTKSYKVRGSSYVRLKFMNRSQINDNPGNNSDNSELRDEVCVSVSYDSAITESVSIPSGTDGQVLLYDGTPGATLSARKIKNENIDVGSVTGGVDNSNVATGSIAVNTIEEGNIKNDAVTNAKLDNMVRGTVKVGGTGNAPTDLNAKGDANILIGDGTDIKSVAVSGDISIDNTGATTIQEASITSSMISDDAVTNDKLDNMTRGTVKVGGTANAPTDLDASGDAKILIGDGTDIKSVAVSGDISIDNTGATKYAQIKNINVLGKIDLGTDRNVFSDVGNVPVITNLEYFENPTLVPSNTNGTLTDEGTFYTSLAKGENLVTADSVVNWVNQKLGDYQPLSPDTATGTPNSADGIQTITLSDDTVPGSIFTVPDFDASNNERYLLIESSQTPISSRYRTLAHNNTTPHTIGSDWHMINGQLFATEQHLPNGINQNALSSDGREWLENSYDHHANTKTFTRMFKRSNYNDITCYADELSGAISAGNKYFPERSYGVQTLSGIELPSLTSGHAQVLISQGITPVIHVYIKSTADWTNDTTSRRYLQGWEHRITPPTFFVNRNDKVNPVNYPLMKQIDLSNPQGEWPSWDSISGGTIETHTSNSIMENWYNNRWTGVRLGKDLTFNPLITFKDAYNYYTYPGSAANVKTITYYPSSINYTPAGANEDFVGISSRWAQSNLSGGQTGNEPLHQHKALSAVNGRGSPYLFQNDLDNLTFVSPSLMTYSTSITNASTKCTYYKLQGLWSSTTRSYTWVPAIGNTETLLP